MHFLLGITIKNIRKTKRMFWWWCFLRWWLYYLFIILFYPIFCILIFNIRFVCNSVVIREEDGDTMTSIMYLLLGFLDFAQVLLRSHSYIFINNEKSKTIDIQCQLEGWGGGWVPSWNQTSPENFIFFELWSLVWNRIHIFCDTSLIKVIVLLDGHCQPNEPSVLL